MNNPFEEIDRRLSIIETMVNNLIHKNQDTSNDPEPLMTVQEIAKFLSLSMPTIYSKISKGELPYMKKGKRVYFLKSEIISHLRSK